MDSFPQVERESLPNIFSGMPTPERVAALEEEVLKLPQIDLQTTHVIHGGIATRTIFIPAGTVITGALTNLDNVCILCGDITVTTDKGAKRLTGFHVIPAGSGFKRAGYAHSDTYWSTSWKTDLTNIEEIENEMTNECAKLQTRNLTLDFNKMEAIECH